ncbi:MAG: putative signal transducing protein [Actinomycetota bacterium]
MAEFVREQEARLLAGRLEAEGIGVRMYPEWQGGPYGETLLLPVAVLVQEHRLLEAREIIEEIERSEPEETD